jgi:hypothetical protein
MSFVAIPVSFCRWCHALTATTLCNLVGNASLRALERSDRAVSHVVCLNRNRFLKVVIYGIGDWESAVVQHNPEYVHANDLEIFHYFAHSFPSCGVGLND